MNIYKVLNEYLELLEEELAYKDGIIDSDITISLAIPDIDLYIPNDMHINKPLYIDTVDEVKNNSINELKEKYLKNVELVYIEDDNVNN